RLGARLRSMCLLEPVLFGALYRARRETDDDAAAEEARGFFEHPWFLHDAERGGTDAWLEGFIDYWNRPGPWARLPPAQQDPLRAVGWKMFQEVRACVYAFDSFADARLPEVPCTLVVGTRSTRASRAMTRAVAAESPHARVVEIEAGHMAPVTHPALVHAAM